MFGKRVGMDLLAESDRGGRLASLGARVENLQVCDPDAARHCNLRA
jgi:hypothetical protein